MMVARELNCDAMAQCCLHWARCEVAVARGTCPSFAGVNAFTVEHVIGAVARSSCFAKSDLRGSKTAVRENSAFGPGSAAERCQGRMVRPNAHIATQSFKCVM